MTTFDKALKLAQIILKPYAKRSDGLKFTATKDGYCFTPDVDNPIAYVELSITLDGFVTTLHVYGFVEFGDIVSNEDL